jgi:hypothetical protein
MCSTAPRSEPAAVVAAAVRTRLLPLAPRAKAAAAGLPTASAAPVKPSEASSWRRLRRTPSSIGLGIGRFSSRAWDSRGDATTTRAAHNRGWTRRNPQRRLLTQGLPRCHQHACVWRGQPASDGATMRQIAPVVSSLTYRAPSGQATASTAASVEVGDDGWDDDEPEVRPPPPGISGTLTLGQRTPRGRNWRLMRGPLAPACLGTLCSHVRWQLPPMTRRSPRPSAKALEVPPPRGRNKNRRGVPRETIATMVSSVRLRPMRSPCHATLSHPSR